MFLQAASSELVNSPLIMLKYAYMAYCRTLHFGLMLLSMVYFLTRAEMSSSARKMVVPMCL